MLGVLRLQLDLQSEVTRVGKVQGRGRMPEYIRVERAPYILLCGLRNTPTRISMHIGNRHYPRILPRTKCR